MCGLWPWLRRTYNLYFVGADVKPCSINQSAVAMTGDSRIFLFLLCERIVALWWLQGTEEKQEAKLSLGYPTLLPHSTFGGHVTSSVTWPFDSPYAISYWWSFGTKPLSLTETVRDRGWTSRNGWHDLDTTSKRRSRSFILVWYQSISHRPIRLSTGSQ